MGRFGFAAASPSSRRTDLSTKCGIAWRCVAADGRATCRIAMDRTRHSAQLAAASAVLERSLERLANLSDVRLLVSEVLTSIIEVAGAAGGALLRFEPNTQTLVLQSYVLEGLVIDI